MQQQYSTIKVGLRVKLIFPEKMLSIFVMFVLNFALYDQNCTQQKQEMNVFIMIRVQALKIVSNMLQFQQPHRYKLLLAFRAPYMTMYVRLFELQDNIRVEVAGLPVTVGLVSLVICHH